MRSVFLAMTENEHDHRSWRCTGLVGLFILLTLALNASTREQAALIRESYNDSNEYALLLFTVAVTAGQILTAVAVISCETARGEMPCKEALAIVLFSHMGTTFLHDYLLSLGSTQHSLTTAYMQPLLSLVALWIVTSVPARPLMWITLLTIGLGFTFMSIKPGTVFASDRTSLVAALSSFALILRNIVIRQLVSIENVTVKLRSSRTLTAVLISVLAFIVSIFLLTSRLWLAPSICAVTTCVLSVSLMYVTIRLSKTYSVTFISLFYTWALLLEAVSITPDADQPDIFMTLIALVFVLFGHYVYIKDYVEQREAISNGLTIPYTQKPVNTHEQYTRIEFLLFASFVMGVIFYVFQPRVSQRDLRTLSYVGLDKVIRRLLTVDEETEILDTGML